MNTKNKQNNLITHQFHNLWKLGPDFTVEKSDPMKGHVDN